MLRYVLYARKSQEDEGRQQQSIDDQVAVMTEQAERLDLPLARILTEERSAKEPYQRPVFDELMGMVLRGEAEAILCYHVNRLARNMVEGGLLQHYLTKGIIKEVRTSTEIFRGGDNILPFVLQAAMSTQYSLDLSRVVRRGIDSKLSKGGWPHRAPDGYLNERLDRSVVIDEQRFPLVRRAWDLLLSASYSAEQIRTIMNEKWGYRVRPTRGNPAHPISKTCLHRMFHNAFYAGYLCHNGQWYEGAHPAMITMDEFKRAQTILGRLAGTRPAKHEFAYTRGLITCGHCGHMVTAQLNRGRHNRGTYIYYHCTNYRVCGGATVREEVIDDAITRILDALSLEPSMEQLAYDVITRFQSQEVNQMTVQRHSITDAIQKTEERKGRLLRLATEGLVSDEEFASERVRLTKELNDLRQAASQTQDAQTRAQEGATRCVAFAARAHLVFAGASAATRRQIAQTLCTGYQLTGGRMYPTVHPQLANLLIETPPRLETGSQTTKNRLFEKVVPCGGTEDRLIESLRAIWNQLLEGDDMIDSPEFLREPFCRRPASGDARKPH